MKNCVLITSKLIVSKNGFSYTPVRSVFSPKERYEQTVYSIKSVRDQIPRAFIVFIDNSIIPQEWADTLRSAVDVFINESQDQSLNFDTNEHLTKAVGELSQIRYALNNFQLDAVEFSRFYKLCARYFVNSSFQISDHKQGFNIVKIHEPLIRYRIYTPGVNPVVAQSTLSYFTTFYSIDSQYFQTYKAKVDFLYDRFCKEASLRNEPLESHQFSNFPSVLPVRRIGVSGKASVDSSFVIDV
jgi:hypothetical protein